MIYSNVAKYIETGSLLWPVPSEWAARIAIFKDPCFHLRPIQVTSKVCRCLDRIYMTYRRSHSNSSKLFQLWRCQYGVGKPAIAHSNTCASFSGKIQKCGGYSSRSISYTCRFLHCHIPPHRNIVRMCERSDCYSVETGFTYWKISEY